MEDCQPLLPNTQTDHDLCISEYIEIVPLDTTRNNFSTMDSNEIDCSADIKQEIFEEIKQEPDEANEGYNIRAGNADAEVCCMDSA